MSLPDCDPSVDELRAEMEAETLEPFHEGDRSEDPEEYPEELDGCEERLEDDGQPFEHQEWQDLPFGGDELPADFDQFSGDLDVDGMGPDSE